MVPSCGAVGDGDGDGDGAEVVRGGGVGGGCLVGVGPGGSTVQSLKSSEHDRAAASSKSLQMTRLVPTRRVQNPVPCVHSWHRPVATVPGFPVNVVSDRVAVTVQPERGVLMAVVVVVAWDLGGVGSLVGVGPVG